jgi:hypothetical protein
MPATTSFYERFSFCRGANLKLQLGPMLKFVFLDTMIYLHFKSVEEIDWPTLVGADEVRILIPRITTTELDKHKDSHPKAKVRDRARRMLRLFETTVGTGRHELRKGVTLERFTRRPRFDLATYDLDSGRNDDQLIAAVLEFKLGEPSADVIIVSDDSTARMTARDVGLAAIELPQNHKIRHEPDELEEENRKLREELNRYKNAIPRLSLRFSQPEPGNLIHVRLPPALSRDNYIQNEIAKLEAKYPVLTPKLPDLSGKGFDISLLAGLGTPPHEYDRYNSERQPYFDAYAQYLRDTWEIQVKKTLTFPVVLELANEVTAVATDVDVFVYFPGGMEVLEQSELDERLERMPNPPRPPQRPRTSEQILRESFSSSVYSPYVPDFSFMRHIESREVPNVRRPSIEETGSYDVIWNIRRVKHKQVESLHPLAVVFESFESAQSFKIEYVLHAANLPSEVDGQLNVVVQKEA